MRRVAVVGCGVGRNHIGRGYRKHPDKFRVEALCEVDAARLQAVGEEFSIPRRSLSYDEVLRMDDIDIVDICTPAALHFRQSLGALSAGKEVVCEKPLVGTLAEIDELIAAEKEAAGRVMPIFQYRYGDGVQKGQADHRCGAGREALSDDRRDRVETDPGVLPDTMARAPADRARRRVADARDPQP